MLQDASLQSQINEIYGLTRQKEDLEASLSAQDFSEFLPARDQKDVQVVPNSNLEYTSNLSRASRKKKEKEESQIVYKDFGTHFNL